MQFIDEINCNGKKFIVRADLNVPFDENGKITDDSRIKGFLPTLQYILKNNGSAVVMSHLGEPETAAFNPAFSLKPIAMRIAELLGKDIQLASDVIGDSAKTLVANIQPGNVVLLENLRFHPGEKKNDASFAQELAKFGDVYVCDAFATAHRSHASMVGVPRIMKDKVGGLLVKQELNYFEKALLNPKRPLCVVLGGSKVSTKLNVLLNIAPKADKLIIGGAMANTFLAAQGLQVGRSLFEADLIPKALEILGSLARRECKLYLPVDVMVGPSPTSKGFAKAVPVQEIPADLMALDIGPATRLLFQEAVQSPETILWNGPMGAFENEDYSKGTTDMIESLSNAHGLTVVGGGDTDAAIHSMQLAHKFNYISTGGGAFLTLLEGKKLPAFEALG